jgi:alkanesulfonate monooxygenase SsuD/methylene tetrahydromethanopterin reductase-like flavin-dependent oxidoreductase (luciferase family)
LRRRTGTTATGTDGEDDHMTDGASGRARAFRFGIVAPVLSDLPTWREQVRRIADHGYSTVLMPDFPRLQPAPAAALAVAATVADVRVGTWVYAAPFRAPWLTAWEAHSLTMLTQGRFEMGIGVGRPGIEDELRERGLPVPSPGRRLEQVRESVAALRGLDGDQNHTPVAMAVIGPRARALAAEIADTVTFAMAPNEPRAAVQQRVRDFSTTRDVELSLHIPVVGDAVSPFMAPPDTDTTALRAADSLAYLPPDAAAAADELRRRREETGVSYFAFGANVADTFAPLVAELTGR